jgi:hypothetical protein
MEAAASLFVDLLLYLLDGKPLKETLMSEMKTQQSPFAGYPFLNWLNEADEMVVGRRFSTACYVEDSVPSCMKLHLIPTASRTVKGSIL